MNRPGWSLLVLLAAAAEGLGAQPPEPRTGPGADRSAAGAVEEFGSAELKLQRVDAKGAVVVLRSIAGIRQVEALDAQTILVRETPEKLLLARGVVELMERADDAPEALSTFEVGDGTVVARALLRQASGDDVMVALRTLGIRSMAVVGEPASVIVRDRAEQVAVALERILALEREAHRSSTADDARLFIVD